MQNESFSNTGRLTPEMARTQLSHERNRRAESQARGIIERTARDEGEITLLDLENAVEACNIGLFGLREWAYRFLSLENPTGGHRYSYETISSYEGPYATSYFLMELANYAARRKKLPKLLQVFNEKTPKVKGNNEIGNAKYIWVGPYKVIGCTCGYCGREQPAPLAEGNRPIVEPCEGCGSKLKFDFNFALNNRLKGVPPEAVEKQIKEQQAQIKELRRQYTPNWRTELRGLLIKMAELQRMDLHDVQLWAARLYLACEKDQTIVAKLPYEDMPNWFSKQNLIREMIHYADYRLPPEATIKMLLQTIIQANEVINTGVGVVGERRTYFCHSCNDVFDLPLGRVKMHTISVDGGISSEGFVLQQPVCSCGSIDVHYNADSNPQSELLTHQFDKLKDYLLQHFSTVEMRKLDMYMHGIAQPIWENIAGHDDRLSFQIAEFIEHFSRRNKIGDLINQVNTFRKKSAMSGIMQNIECQHCGRLDNRIINKEGFMGGSCHSCGSTEFQMQDISVSSGLAQRSPAFTTLGPHFITIHGDVIPVPEREILAQRTEPTDTDSQHKSYSQELTLQQVKDLNNILDKIMKEKKYWLFGYILRNVFSKNDLLKLFQRDPHLRSIYDNFSNAVTPDLAARAFVQLYNQGTFTHLPDFFQRIVMLRPHKIPEILKRVPEIPMEIPSFEISIPKMIEVIAYMDPEFYQREKSKEVYKPDVWIGRYSQLKNDKRLKSLFYQTINALYS